MVSGGRNVTFFLKRIYLKSYIIIWILKLIGEPNNKAFAHNFIIFAPSGLKLWNDIKEKAGVENLRFHDLRHFIEMKILKL